MAKISPALRIEARNTLREILTEKHDVYVTVRKVATSGMSRILSMHVIVPDYDGKPHLRDITSLAARAAGFTYVPDAYGFRIGGCGMDMTWAAVNDLSGALSDEAAGLKFDLRRQNI